jgi:hypothetical protein
MFLIVDYVVEKHERTPGICFKKLYLYRHTTDSLTFACFTDKAMMHVQYMSKCRQLHCGLIRFVGLVVDLIHNAVVGTD